MDQETYGGRKRQVVVVEGIGFPVVTRGYVAVWCKRLQRYVRDVCIKYKGLEGGIVSSKM